MKTLLQRIFYYLLTGVIFVSSTGFGLVEHSCLMSGKEEISLVSRKSCCSNKKATNHCETPQGKKTVSLQKEQCCKEETQYRNVDVSSSLVQAMSQLLASLCAAVLSTFAFLVQSLVETITNSSYLSFAPSLSGKTLLIFLHTFLI